MSARVPETPIRFRNTHRLVPSRYPPVGLFDAVATPEDLDAVLELENWTNDRITAELGLISHIPRAEWVLGRPMASVVMASYCHPAPGGGRFNDGSRGAWYAGRSIATAHAEVIYHRSQEFAEIGVTDTSVQMREYLADFTGRFHDLRADTAGFRSYYHPTDYKKSQQLAADLLSRGSNGVLYRSVRHAGGECIACFRPPLVKNVRQGQHFHYRWQLNLPVSIRVVGSASR